MLHADDRRAGVGPDLVEQIDHLSQPREVSYRPDRDLGPFRGAGGLHMCETGRVR